MYFEETSDVQGAISWERQIKGWTRARKAQLVATMNAAWRDLSADWYVETASAAVPARRKVDERSSPCRFFAALSMT
jgi:hypothetical protein